MRATVSRFSLVVLALVSGCGPHERNDWDRVKAGERLRPLSPVDVMVDNESATTWTRWIHCPGAQVCYETPFKLPPDPVAEQLKKATEELERITRVLDRIERGMAKEANRAD